MSIQFTPQFFSRTPPSATPTASVQLGSLNRDLEKKIEQKKYSPNDSLVSQHGVMQENPRQHHHDIASDSTELGSNNSPSASDKSPLSNASEHYADIDWVKHEIITQDGTRYKFGERQVSDSIDDQVRKHRGSAI